MHPFHTSSTDTVTITLYRDLARNSSMVKLTKFILAVMTLLERPDANLKTAHAKARRLVDNGGPLVMAIPGNTERLVRYLAYEMGLTSSPQSIITL